jgi:hypothetical protein
MASSSSSFVTLAGFSGSYLTTIRPFLSANSQSKITPLDVETPLSPSYGGLPTNVKTYPFPILFTLTNSLLKCNLESEIDAMKGEIFSSASKTFTVERTVSRLNGDCDWQYFARASFRGTYDLLGVPWRCLGVRFSRLSSHLLAFEFLRQFTLEALLFAGLQKRVPLHLLDNALLLNLSLETPKGALERFAVVNSHLCQNSLRDICDRAVSMIAVCVIKQGVFPRCSVTGNRLAPFSVKARGAGNVLASITYAILCDIDTRATAGNSWRGLSSRLLLSVQTTPARSTAGTRNLNDVCLRARCSCSTRSWDDGFRPARCISGRRSSARDCRLADHTQGKRNLDGEHRPICIPPSSLDLHPFLIMGSLVRTSKLSRNGGAAENTSGLNCKRMSDST